MPSALNNAGVFLISTVFDLIIFIFLIRVILILTRVNYFNPVSQFVTKFTQFIITPLRRVIPNFKNIELASILVVLLLELVKFSLIGLLLIGTPHPLGLLVLGIADALKTTANIYFYAILIQAIVSWVHMGYSPIIGVMAQITAPLMRPFQRMIPLIGGMDISPIPAMLVIQLVIILFIGPLFTTGQVMAFG